jgi:UDP-N-acetylmuramoyl-L-alanine---L-glutamate ligase
VSELRGRRVAVWGTGREAIAAIHAIAPAGPADLVAVQDKVTFLATPWEGRLAELAPLHQGEAAHAALRTAEVVVRSPGVAESHPWIMELRDRGTRITGGTALWMAEHAGRTIAVTGSKGKSTTASLISHLLAETGRPNELGGNIGVAVLNLPEADRYVLELSMYQCADLDDSPRIAALTSLMPEHLDWCRNHTAEEYYRHKLNLIAYRPEHVVYNADEAILAAHVTIDGALAAGRPDTFHVRDGVVYLGDEPLFPRTALPLVGRHNAGNLCVALGALQCAGVDCAAEKAALEAALTRFRPLEHRLTPIEDPSGITFVDDSLSTIPQSAIHAIEAYVGRPLTVIVGGEDRGVDYTPLRDFLAEQAVVATLIGVPDSGPRILDAMKGVPTITAVTADDLVQAVTIARERTPEGGVVLLSPAAPSYGRFDNYAHRSRVFRQAIEESRHRQD